MWATRVGPCGLRAGCVAKYACGRGEMRACDASERAREGESKVLHAFLFRGSALFCGSVTLIGFTFAS